VKGRHHDEAITDSAITMNQRQGPGPEEPPVRISRSAIVAILRKRNLDARADWVEHTLPAIVDIRRHTGLLATLHIDPADLTNQQP
jgi:hypothetical protein